MFDSLTPADLGLPRKFTAFRRAQTDALDWAVYECTKRFTGACLPTGSGKSLLALALARALGVKAVYLTATKGLQEQVMRDAAEIGMVDVRGRNNYRCSELPGAWSCEGGIREGCSIALTSHCPAKRAVDIGKESSLVVTNYSWWLHSKGMECGLLICDEVHAAAEQIADFMSVSVACNESDDSGLMSDVEGGLWRSWALGEQQKARKRQKKIEAGYKLSALARKDQEWQELDERIEEYGKITRMNDGWVWEASKGRVHFTPVWPGRYASALWQGVPRVLLISATLRPYTLSLLGLSKDSYDYREWPAVFPPQRSPVYHLPVVKLSWRSKDEDYEKIVAQVDSILDTRKDRRGIIHTGSYARMQTVLAHSRHGARFVFNQSGSDAARTGRDFGSIRTPINAVLVSPSFGTGYDFPGDTAEFQIILKVPFPDTSSRVMKERCKDNDYRMYSAAQTLVQMCGRAMRSAEDRSETFILDSAASWLLSQGRKFLPSGFRVHPITKIPPAPPKIIVDNHATLGVA